MYKLVLSKRFKEELEKNVKGDVILWKKVTKTLHLLSENINHPSLKLHKLTGRNNWSVSISKSQRIIFTIQKEIIFCTDFGKHEEVY